MQQAQISQTLGNLKIAQSAFKNLRTSTKTAFADPSMQMGDKDMMIEKIFQQAEALVDTAITAVETVASGNGGETGMEPGMSNTPPDMETPDVISTDIPKVTDKLNTAMGDAHPDDNDPTKQAMQKMAQQIDEQGKVIDEMKNKEAQMKLAQKYADLHPMAMRTAKFNEFMGHQGPTAVLEARLDEASVLLSANTAQKFAQQEDSLFKFTDDDDNIHSTRVNPGSKI